MADRGDVDEFGRQRGGRPRSRSRSPDSDEDFRRRSRAPASAPRPGVGGVKRGRSRSPGGRSPPRGGRRRSPSPASKRRRPDEYDRRRSEPARGSRSASAHVLQQHRTRLEGPLMTFKEFALTEPDDTDPATSIISYETYKTNYHTKHAQTFFQARKGEQWFLDRYDRVRLASSYISPTDFQTSTHTRYQSFISQYRSTEINFLTQNSDIHQNIPNVDIERKERFVDNCIQVVGLPSRITKEALVQLFSTVTGFSHLYLSPVDTTKQFTRTAYVFYTTQEQTSKAFDQYDFHKLVITPPKAPNPDGEPETKSTIIPKTNGALQPIVLRLRPNPSRISHHMAPHITMEDERVARDLDQATQLAKILDKERSIDENVIFQDGVIHGLTPALKQLNLILYYLRSVHLYCYYCHTQYYASESLFHGCGMIHDRDAKGPSTDADQEWITSLDNAIAQRLITTPEFPNPPPPVDQTIVDKHVEEFYNNTIKKKAEGKFKCNVCAKMFKSADFVRKHIALKHTSELSQAENKANEEMMLELYMADENRPNDIVTSTGVNKRSRSRSPRRRSPSRSRSRSRSRGRGRSRSPPYYNPQGIPVIDSSQLPPQAIVPPPPGHPLLPTPPGYHQYPPPPMPYGGAPPYGHPMMPPPHMHPPPPGHMPPHGPPMHGGPPPPPGFAMGQRAPPPPALTRLAPDPVAAGRRIKSYSDLDAPKENDFVPDYGAFPKKKTTFASLSKWTTKKSTTTTATTTTTTTETPSTDDSTIANAGTTDEMTS